MSDKRARPPEGQPAKEIELSLEDTVAAKMRLKYPDKASRAGHDPYQLDDARKPAAEAEEKKKPTDLRELSKWIKAQRELEAQKAAEAGKDPEQQDPEKK